MLAQVSNSFYADDLQKHAATQSRTKAEQDALLALRELWLDCRLIINSIESAYSMEKLSEGYVLVSGTAVAELRKSVQDWRSFLGKREASTPPSTRGCTW